MRIMEATTNPANQYHRPPDLRRAEATLKNCLAVTLRNVLRMLYHGTLCLWRMQKRVVCALANETGYGPSERACRLAGTRLKFRLSDAIPFISNKDKYVSEWAPS